MLIFRKSTSYLFCFSIIFVLKTDNVLFYGDIIHMTLNMISFQNENEEYKTALHFFSNAEEMTNQYNLIIVQFDIKNVSFNLHR